MDVKQHSTNQCGPLQFVPTMSARHPRTLNPTSSSSSMWSCFSAVTLVTIMTAEKGLSAERLKMWPCFYAVSLVTIMTIQLHCSMQVNILSSSLTGYFNYLILGLRDKAAPPTSQQINKFPPKRVKNLATPSSIFIFTFSSSTGELCPQPIRGNGRLMVCGREATCLLTYARLLQYTRQIQRRGPT